MDIERLKEYRWKDSNGDEWAVRDKGLYFVHPTSVNQPLRHQREADASTPELLRLAAEVEWLKKALNQAIDCAGLSVETVVKDKSYGMWRYEGETVIVGQSSTENFFAGFPDDSPELATYLKEREGS